MDQVRPATGKVYDLGDDVYRIIAPNPSPMTYWGTNTYLIGTRGLALID
ncbi:MAG: MBL fold metallo-hydrolase, partial [Pseudomonadota bacterium]